MSGEAVSGFGFMRTRALLAVFAGVANGRLPLAGNPFLEKSEAHRQQGRPNEDTDESEGQRATDDTKEDQQKRHGTALTDNPRLDDVVYTADSDSPNDHEDSPTSRVLVKQPQRRRNPNQPRTDRNDG